MLSTVTIYTTIFFQLLIISLKLYLLVLHFSCFSFFELCKATITATKTCHKCCHLTLFVTSLCLNQGQAVSGNTAINTGKQLQSIESNPLELHSLIKTHSAFINQAAIIYQPSKISLRVAAVSPSQSATSCRKIAFYQM